MIVSGSAHVSANSTISFFLWPSNTPLYVCASSSLSIHLLMLFLSLIDGSLSPSPCGCLLPETAAAAAAKSLQLCPTLCNPIDGSPPGFPVPGILQARTLEWVAISFSNA